MNGASEKCIIERTGLVAAVEHDVTGRRAEEDAQRFLAAIVESSEDAIVACTPAGIILTWNRGAEAVFGYSAGEAAGKHLSMLAPHERLPGLAHCTERLLQGQTVSQYEGVCLGKDGRRVSVCVTGYPTRNSAGEVAAISAIIRDISERPGRPAAGQEMARPSREQQARVHDLVLMDCQLPEMDGYEASRRIPRHGTAVRNHAIPIIATTAHAMAGDREKCLAAGMNAYISKPLKPAALEQVIQEWTGGMTVAAERAPALPGISASAEAGTVFDREGLVARLMGDEDLAQRIIGGFVGDMPRQIALLAQAVNNLDSKAVRLVAHSIKGAAASVGGLEIREMAWKLEQTGRAGDFAAATALLPELSASFERARPGMERFCRQDPGV